jgi:uncharacterized OsmC-like protein
MSDRSFEVSVSRQEAFVFKADFKLDGVPSFSMDEPKPLGNESGPNASRVLAAAVGNCLCASLLFCLQKSKAEVSDVKANVNGLLHRNPEGRWRIKEINVEILPVVHDDDSKKLERCVKIFEDFCIVSQSVREGIPINVNICS